MRILIIFIAHLYRSLWNTEAIQKSVKVNAGKAPTPTTPWKGQTIAHTVEERSVCPPGQTLLGLTSTLPRAWSFPGLCYVWIPQQWTAFFRILKWYQWHKATHTFCNFLSSTQPCFDIYKFVQFLYHLLQYPLLDRNLVPVIFAIIINEVTNIRISVFL